LRRGCSNGSAATKTSTTITTIKLRSLDIKLLSTATFTLSIASSFHLPHSSHDDLYLNTLHLSIMLRLLNITQIHVLFATL
jgi:hypothetical protein